MASLKIPFLLIVLAAVDFAAASTSLYLYSGNACADFNPRVITGTNDGICTPIQATFYSWRIMEIDPGCEVTVYGSNNSYCGLGYKFWLEEHDICYGNYSAIDQFTVDCESTNITDTSRAAPSDGVSLSTGSKIALGVSIPGSLIAFSIIAVYFWRRWRRHKQQPAHGPQLVSQPQLPPGEMASEKRMSDWPQLQSTPVSELQGFGPRADDAPAELEDQLARQHRLSFMERQVVRKSGCIQRDVDSSGLGRRGDEYGSGGSDWMRRV